MVEREAGQSSDTSQQLEDNRALATLVEVASGLP